MIKVLFLSQWYPHRYDPMAGLFVKKHAQAVSLYCDVACLYVYPDVYVTKQEILVTTEKGFTEIRVYYPAAGITFFARLKKQFYYLKAYKTGYKKLNQIWGKPDIIQANIFTRTPLIALFLKISKQIPYVVIEHWTRYFREKTFHNYLHKILSIYVAKHASAVMPVTLHLQKNMETLGMKNENYQVINNVVDNIFFEKIGKQNTKPTRILNVTCFDDEQKNLSGLLSIIQLLYKKRQDFELYLVGDGIDFEKIKQLSIQLGLENKVVFFTGVLTGKKLVELYQQSHFTVLFSNYENIPVVISESLVCGLPVVTTNVGGIAEHINKSNGLLVDAKDEKGLFDSINYMLDNYQNYNRLELMEEANQKYSYQSVGHKLYTIYSTILKL